MKILLLSDKSANAYNWLNALSDQPGVEAHLWSMKRLAPSLRFFSFLWTLLRIRFVVKRYKPDLLIGYRTTSYGFIGACSGFKPLIVAAQGESDVWPPGHWTNFLTKCMARFAFRRSDLIHAWAPHMAESMYKIGAPLDKILILNRGIKLIDFPYKAPFTNPESICFICTRSLFPEYHHDLILMALREIEEVLSTISFSIYFVGEGILKSSLVRLGKELKIKSKIVWVGKVAPNEIGKWLHQSDIYISLPDTEGLSSSLLEAMACGCFPIVTDLPANREWIKSDNHGKLVKLELVSIVKACKEVISNRYDLIKGTFDNRKLVEQYADSKKNNAVFVERYRQILACVE